MRLAGDLAMAAAARGAFDEAAQLIEEVEVRLLKGGRGWEEGEVGRLCLTIAHVYHAASAGGREGSEEKAAHADAARQYCSKGVQATVAAWGAHHPLLLELHGLMAEIDAESGDAHGCLAQRQVCLRVASVALGLNHLATACYANAVGLDSLRLAAGEAAEAVALHRRALATYEADPTTGKGHAGTASCAFYLAAALCRAGDHEEAAAMATEAAETRRRIVRAKEEKDEAEVLLLMESLAQVAEIAEARSDFVSASAALRELLEGGLPVRGAAAERTIESATASTLRVCLRTQIPLELSAALQQPSAAVAALFRQAAAARAQRQQHRAEELTEAAQRQMHKVRQSLPFSFCVR